MADSAWVHDLGYVASILLPFFNIPLMVRLIRRKSSEDLSLVWVIGVFLCIVGMLPAGWHSSDKMFKIFSVLNLIFFGQVTALTIYFRCVKRRKECGSIAGK